MTKRIVFCCGMFRSGSTLLGRVLNAHPAMSVESDPFLNFFKVLRADIAATIGLDRHYSAPIGDYYFCSDELRLLAAVREARLDQLSNGWVRSDLWSFVRKHGEPFAPRIMSRLQEVKGDTYQDLLFSLFELTAAPGADLFGVKEVWIDEFIPPLATAFPEMKFIEIVRDPRAVCASKNVKPEKYPWLFLCRQWRKLAALAWSHANEWESLAGRVLVVRYEDLVLEPEAEIRRMTSFLGVPFAAEMLDPNNYLDGKGERWQQNTSYSGVRVATSTASIDQWRKTLDDEQVAFIESICGLEMALFGYEPVARNQLEGKNLRLAFPCVEEADLAKWIRRQYPSNRVDTAVELAKEQLRTDLLNLTSTDLATIDDGLLQSAFLFRSVFEELARRRSTRGH